MSWVDDAENRYGQDVSTWKTSRERHNQWVESKIEHITTILNTAVHQLNVPPVESVLSDLRQRGYKVTGPTLRQQTMSFPGYCQGNKNDRLPDYLLIMHSGYHSEPDGWGGEISVDNYSVYVVVWEISGLGEIILYPIPRIESVVSDWWYANDPIDGHKRVQNVMLKGCLYNPPFDWGVDDIAFRYNDTPIIDSNYDFLVDNLKSDLSTRIYDHERSKVIKTEADRQAREASWLSRFAKWLSS